VKVAITIAVIVAGLVLAYDAYQFFNRVCMTDIECGCTDDCLEPAK